jgi:hypothetical protein
MAMPIIAQAARVQAAARQGQGRARRNDFQTRDVELVIAAISHLLPHGTHIWETFAGTAARRLSTGLEAAGYTVSCTGLPEQDFFETEPPPGANMVVSNPPFDQRTAIVERLNALGLPYCMLMPMNTLETDARQAALSEGHPLTLCVLARRARFLTAEGAIIRGAPMGCAWFCKLPDTPGGFVFPPY